MFERDGRIGGLCATASRSSRWTGRCWTGGLGADDGRGRPVHHATVPSAIDLSVSGSAPALRRHRAGHRFDGAAGAQVEGRRLDGVELAMDYLVQQNQVCEGTSRRDRPITAQDKHVVIIGGGDTGADCYGTALRQGAASVTQLDIHRQPPCQPARIDAVADLPAAAAHVGRSRRGRPAGVRGQLHPARRSETDSVTGIHLIEGKRMPGRLHPDRRDSRHAHAGRSGAAGAGLRRSGAGVCWTGSASTWAGRGTVNRDDDYMTNMPGIFVAGDAGRGQSLIVWAIAEGRSAAAAVDKYLSGGSGAPGPAGAHSHGAALTRPRPRPAAPPPPRRGSTSSRGSTRSFRLAVPNKLLIPATAWHTRADAGRAGL